MGGHCNFSSARIETIPQEWNINWEQAIPLLQVSPGENPAGKQTQAQPVPFPDEREGKWTEEGQRDRRGWDSCSASLPTSLYVRGAQHGGWAAVSHLFRDCEVPCLSVSWGPHHLPQLQAPGLQVSSLQVCLQSKSRLHSQYVITLTTDCRELRRSETDSLRRWVTTFLVWMFNRTSL